MNTERQNDRGIPKYSKLFNLSTAKHQQHERASNRKVFQLSFTHSKNCARAKPVGGNSREIRSLSGRKNHGWQKSYHIHLCANTPNISNAIQWHLAVWQVRKLQNRCIWQDDWKSWKNSDQISLECTDGGSEKWFHILGVALAMPWLADKHLFYLDRAHSKGDHRKTCLHKQTSEWPAELGSFFVSTTKWITLDVFKNDVTNCIQGPYEVRESDICSISCLITAAKTERWGIGHAGYGKKPLQSHHVWSRLLKLNVGTWDTLPTLELNAVWALHIKTSLHMRLNSIKPHSIMSIDICLLGWVESLSNNQTVTSRRIKHIDLKHRIWNTAQEVLDIPGPDPH